MIGLFPYFCYYSLNIHTIQDDIESCIEPGWKLTLTFIHLFEEEYGGIILIYWTCVDSGPVGPA